MRIVSAKQDIKDLPEYYQEYLLELDPLESFHTGDVKNALAKTYENTMDLFSQIPEQHAHYAYAPEKWSIIEVMGHMIDVERIFAYRALRIARCEQENFSSFDENLYIINSSYHLRDIAIVKQELLTIEESTGYLFDGFTEDELHQLGSASGIQLTPNTIGFVTAAHRNHHLNILKERYLSY